MLHEKALLVRIIFPPAIVSFVFRSRLWCSCCDGRWRSPFAHGEGSSWHSPDSLLVMAVFCHLDVLIGLVAAAVCLWARGRKKRRRAAFAGLALLVLAFLHRQFSIISVECLIGRIWIWLIMT